MVQAITIFFGLIGGAILFDVAFNQGEAISSMLRALRGSNQTAEKDDKLDMSKELLEEIDSLRDDLEYDDISEVERNNILQKIAIREKMLEKLL